jgi:hypothetical protein
MGRAKEQFIVQRANDDGTAWIDEAGPFTSTAEALKGARKGGTPDVPYRVVSITSKTFTIEVEQREVRKLATQEAKE